MTIKPFEGVGLIDAIIPRQPNDITISLMVRKAMSVTIGGGYKWSDYMRDLYEIVVRSRINAEIVEAYKAQSVHASDCATHNEPYKPNGPCDCAPKVGDTMIRDGRVWRCYEIELEGAKYTDIGPVTTSDVVRPRGSGVAS